MAAGKRSTYRLSPAEPITATDVRWWWVADAAFAALRVLVAVLIVRHGFQDHFGFFMPRGQAWLGAPAPLTDRWIAATVELAAGALLLAGLFTRFAAVVLGVVVILAAFAPPGARGHWMPHGAELVTLYTSALAFFSIVGGGLFSVDTPRSGRPRRRKTAMSVSMSPWIKREYRQRELTR